MFTNETHTNSSAPLISASVNSPDFAQSAADASLQQGGGQPQGPNGDVRGSLRFDFVQNDADKDPDVLTPTPNAKNRPSGSAQEDGVAPANPESRDDTPVVFEDASLRATLFNVINSVLGAGALGLPYAAKLDGMALGAFLIVLIGGLSERTAYFLLHATEHTRARLYSQAGAAIYGATAGIVVDVTIIIQNLGLLCSYVVVIGDLIPSIIAAWAPGHDGKPYDGRFAPGNKHGRVLIQIIIAAVLFLPLSSLANLDALKFTSVLAVLAVCATVIVVVIVSALAMHDPYWIPTADKVHSDPAVNATDIGFDGALGATEISPSYVIRAGPDSFISFLESVPMVFTAYVAHNNILLLYTELRRRSSPERESKFASKKDKMMVAVRIGLATCCTLYLLVGCFGYNLFRDNTNSDVLSNFLA